MPNKIYPTKPHNCAACEFFNPENPHIYNNISWCLIHTRPVDPEMSPCQTRLESSLTFLRKALTYLRRIHT